MAADRHPRAAPRRRLRAAPHRHRPARRRDHDPLADHPARLGHRPGRPRNPTRGSGRSPSTPTPSPTSAPTGSRQDKEKEAAGDAWTETGFEFTSPDGTPLHPAAVTDIFEQLAYLAGLPPIRLHDLRHGAATLLLAAGHDMKVVQETLGLSSITIAADTYTSVLPQLARQSAEDVAALIRHATSQRRGSPD